MDERDERHERGEDWLAIHPADIPTAVMAIPTPPSADSPGAFEQDVEFAPDGRAQAAPVPPSYSGAPRRSASRATLAARRIPRWLIVLWIILTFDAGMVTAFSLPLGAVGILLAVSIGVGLWVYRRAGLLVAALTLLVLSLPFNTAVSRFGISPQEVLLYAIWLVGALFSPLGARRWLLQVFSSLSPFARFALLLFALAAAQSAFRIAHPDVVALTDSLRQIVVFTTLLAFIIAYAIRTYRCMPTLLQAFAASAGLFAIYALALRLLDVGLGNGAVAGRLGSEASFLLEYHPNNLGLYLAFGLVFAPALVLRALQSRMLSEVQLGAICIGATLSLIALWLTYSRGALVALGVSVVVLLIGVFAHSRNRRRLLGYGLVGAAAVGLVFALVLVARGPAVLGRYLQLLSPSTLQSDPSVQFRLDLYQRAWSIVQAHPFTGIGFGGFTQDATVPFSPHDTYLDVLVSTGIFGLLALLLIVAIGIVSALRASSRFDSLHLPAEAMDMLAVAAALTAFLVQAFTETFSNNPRIFPAVWVFVACADATLAVLSSAQLARVRQPTMPPVSASQAHAPVPPVLTFAESTWALDTGPMPTIGALEESAFGTSWDSTDRLAAIWPWRVGSRRSAKRYGGTGGTGGPQLGAGSYRNALPSTLVAPGMSAGAATSERAREQAVSRELLRRAPVSYIWNQAYTLWYFATNFLLSVAIARQLSQQEYGIYSVLLTILTTLLSVFAFGLEDLATVFVPRLLAMGGEGMAGALVRRILLSRVLVLCLVGVVLVIVVPTQAPLLAAHGIPLDVSFLQGPHGVLLRVGLMAAYLVGNGIGALENALFASVLRSRVTLLVGGVSQVLTVALAAAILALGGGVDGLFAVLAGVAWLTAAAYLIALRPLLVARGQQPSEQGRPMRGLMFSAWITNITNSALGKQSDILLMGAFAVSYAAIGYYNLAYQLANILGVLLISGLTGVGVATMSAAFSEGGSRRLAGIWRAVVMLQILLTAPVLTFGTVRANLIVSTLYGARYADAVPMLQVFLLSTLIGRLIGGGVHQSALFVAGRQKVVLINRTVGLIVNVGLDVALIPHYGPYGALAATSVTQLMVGTVEQVLVRRYLPVRYPSAFAGRVLGASALAAVGLIWWSPQNLAGLAASFIVFAVVLVIALLALGMGDTADVQRILDLRPNLRLRLQALQERLLGAPRVQGQGS